MTVRVRYAPSPTGHLHIGGVRTALFNYLFAKRHNGVFLLRIEDTDIDRNVEGAEQGMLDGFRWLGFDWAEGPDVGGPHAPYRCMESLDIYDKYVAQLKAEGRLYPCYCTPEELAADRERLASEGKTPRYVGRCRHLTDEERAAKEAEGRKPTWRFKVTEGQTLEFEDLVRGHVSFETADLDDWVVLKSNGIPTYNFQVVIDDARMEITHVIRGEEHLSNTPRQLLVYQALGFTQPVFAHLPQVLNTNRKKLSKRDPNVMPVDAYRQAGYLPEALVNFLALLGWSPGGEQEIMSLEEVASQFSLERVNRSGAIFDTDKLHWMSTQYIKALPMETLTAMVRTQLDRHGWTIPAGKDESWLQQVVTLYHEQMACAEDFLKYAAPFFVKEIEWEEEALALFSDESAVAVVRRYAELSEADKTWDAESSRARFKQVQTELGVKGRGLFMPVRAAVLGAVHGPDLQSSIASLSAEWVSYRVNALLHRLGLNAE